MGLYFYGLNNTMNNSILALLSKYDKPIPRYTSYPTVPYWQPETIDAEKWKNSVLKTLESENGEFIFIFPIVKTSVLFAHAINALLKIIK